jgi:hypothetical protein
MPLATWMGPPWPPNLPASEALAQSGKGKQGKPSVRAAVN